MDSSKDFFQAPVKKLTDKAVASIVEKNGEAQEYGLKKRLKDQPWTELKTQPSLARNGNSPKLNNRLAEPTEWRDS